MISPATSPHYIWADVCDGWKLVDTPGLNVIQERMPTGTQEVRHQHSRVRQFFYVLRGELTLDVDGAAQVIPAGSGLEVQPGQVHQARNESGADVEFLVISDGISRDDRVEVTG
ncbi:MULTISPECIES: cupin domain-containing protein [Deinococcus]|uniref:Cupin domain-containing protein n=1 Tax=Deinococcus rufus TaxID=2136097 RepID=A0ABV7Z5Q2_9DEIO|nr:cupin domain-containing protein [Deinococcus sp. AB2017081]WQE95793.1 cupin domain-containing protein [Deinococcus sp. AB2017081]